MGVPCPWGVPGISLEGRGPTCWMKIYQGIGKDVPQTQRTPSWEIPVSKPYITWVFMGNNPQESLENTITTMGTLLGVHPIAP